MQMLYSFDVLLIPTTSPKSIEKRSVHARVSRLTNGFLTECQPSEVVVAGLGVAGALVLVAFGVVVVVVGADVAIVGPEGVRS